MNLWQSMCAPPRGVLIWRSLAGSAALMLACLVGTAPAFAQNAYITNEIDSTVSVIDTATNMVIGSPIPVLGPITATPRDRSRRNQPSVSWIAVESEWRLSARISAIGWRVSHRLLPTHPGGSPWAP